MDLLCINFFDEEGGRREIAPILGCCIGDGYLEVGMDWTIRFFEETPLTWIVYGCVLRALGFLRDVLGTGWSVNFRTLIDFVIKIYKIPISSIKFYKQIKLSIDCLFFLLSTNFSEL